MQHHPRPSDAVPDGVTGPETVVVCCLISQTWFLFGVRHVANIPVQNNFHPIPRSTILLPKYIHTPMRPFHQAANAILRTVIASGGRQRVSSLPANFTHRWTVSTPPTLSSKRLFSASNILGAVKTQQKGDDKLMELVEKRYLTYQDAVKAVSVILARRA